MKKLYIDRRCENTQNLNLKIIAPRQFVYFKQYITSPISSVRSITKRSTLEIFTIRCCNEIQARSSSIRICSIEVRACSDFTTKGLTKSNKVYLPPRSRRYNSYEGIETLSNFSVTCRILITNSATLPSDHYYVGNASMQFGILVHVPNFREPGPQDLKPITDQDVFEFGVHESLRYSAKTPNSN